MFVALNPIRFSRYGITSLEISLISSWLFGHAPV
jgi:hypothetical protein